MKATKHSDPEIAGRAEALVKKLEETVSPELLKKREFDVVHTAHSKIAGKIEANSLKAMTLQFGEVQFQLVHVMTLLSKNSVAVEDTTNVEPAPANLGYLQAHIGKTFRFKVTANPAGSVWGTDVYTTDSTLAAVVIHAGLLKPGQTGVISVSIVQSPNLFVGSLRNGVTSTAYDRYPAAYKVHK